MAKTTSSSSSSQVKVSFTDFAMIIGIYLPMLRVLYPEIEKEINGLGESIGKEVLTEKLPNLTHAVDILKQINVLVTT